MTMMTDNPMAKRKKINRYTIVQNTPSKNKNLATLTQPIHGNDVRFFERVRRFCPICDTRRVAHASPTLIVKGDYVG